MGRLTNFESAVALVGTALIGVGVVVGLTACQATTSDGSGVSVGQAPHGGEPSTAKATKKAKPKAKTSYSDGTWLVGKSPDDIRPGRYRAKGSDNCYWERDKNSLGNLDSILDNSIDPGPQVVTIRTTDYAFKTKGCGKWTKG